jgi:hypothetical protein
MNDEARMTNDELSPAAIYAGSDGEATKALYARLEGMGRDGLVAMNLFRACKASERAKKYRRKFKGLAYEKKNWSLKLLCDALASSDRTWGWAEDPEQEFHRWVLYVELPTGQVSFHAAQPLTPHPYHGHWDGTYLSAERIVRYVEMILGVKPEILKINQCIPGDQVSFDRKVRRGETPRPALETSALPGMGGFARGKRRISSGAIRPSMGRRGAMGVNFGIRNVDHVTPARCTRLVGRRAWRLRIRKCIRLLLMW